MKILAQYFREEIEIGLAKEASLAMFTASP